MPWNPPVSPAPDDEYTYDGVTYKWVEHTNGEGAWKIVSIIGSGYGQLADDNVWTGKNEFQGEVVLPPPTLNIMTKADFFALAEKRKRAAAGSGVVEWGLHIDSVNETPINQGLNSGIQSSNELRWGRYDGAGIGISRTGEPIFNVNGVLLKVRGIGANPTVRNEIFFPPAPDGLDRPDGTRSSVYEAGNVINRQDFCFLEVWHEKVSDKDILVPFGNGQYGATDWNGIALVGLDTLGVAQGYSAFGEFDTATQGNGVQWSSLSDADKAKFVSDPENNIYLEEDGDLVQVRYRIRTVAGLEGDWDFTQPHKAGFGEMLAHNGAERVQTQGSEVVARGIASGIADGFVPNTNAEAFDRSDLGLWQRRGPYSDARAHNGLLFAVPICLVSRHNTGVYSPEYNSRGADKQTGNQFWYEDPSVINSTADCFANTHGGGDIASGISGRSDGEYYDAIYAKYVQDLRKSSLVRPVDEIREEYKRKAIAGQPNFTPTMWEKAPFTTVYTPSINSAAPGARTYACSFSDDASVGDLLSIVNNGVVITANNPITNVSGNVVTVRDPFERSDYSATGRDIHTKWIEQRAAEHTWVDLIGVPSRLAAAFPDGVQGQWIPQIPPTSGVAEYKFNRKYTAEKNLQRTFDNGLNWDSGPWGGYGTGDAVKNSLSLSSNSNMLYLLHYTTPAHFTEDRVNAEVSSLGEATSAHYISTFHGCILGSSLIGKVNTNSNTVGPSVYVSRPMDQVAIQTNPSTSDPFGSLVTSSDWGIHTHSPLNLVTANDSPAVKTLDYLTKNSGVLDLQYVYKEMVYDTTWGDNNIFEITDNQSTLTDENGNTVLYGTAGFETAYFYAEHEKS